MKKIGVITWFRYQNYGTVLQAGALQEYLKSLNTSPALIEIPSIVIRANKKITFNYIKNKIEGKLGEKYICLRYKKDSLIKAKKFHNFIYDNFKVQPLKDNFVCICNEYDLLICGSDQIWNPNWFNDFYFANYPEITTPKLSYAPSIGVKHLPQYLLGSYYNALQRFKYLSVRENTARNEIVNRLGLKCETVIDPIFLLTKEEWLSLIDKNTHTMKYDDENYILCYMLGENRKHWKAIHRYAKKHDMKIKIIPMKLHDYFEKGEVLKDSGPLDFLRNLAKARMIMTDSFHASAFSIIFHKPFYVFERTERTTKESQNSRIYDLLEIAGLEKRLIEYNSDQINERGTIDYDFIEDKLSPIVDKSKAFLNEAIKSI